MAKRKSKKPKKEKRVTKDQKKQELLKSIPIVGPYVPNIVDLTANVEVLKSVTEMACWRPDIYLDNGKYCDGCRLFVGCSYPKKRIAEKKARTK